jgi:hypothetical protein
MASNAITNADLESRLHEIDSVLRWAPRDHSGRIATLEKRLKEAKERCVGLDAAHAEAKWKAHRYRFVPLVGEHWARQLEARKQHLEAAEAQVKFLSFKLKKAQQQNEKRQVWQQMFAPEIKERQELKAERSRRARELGRERLSDVRLMGGVHGWDTPLTKRGEDRWLQRQGERELRRRAAEERRQEAQEAEQRRGQGRAT